MYLTDVDGDVWAYEGGLWYLRGDHTDSATSGLTIHDLDELYGPLVPTDLKG